MQVEIMLAVEYLKTTFVKGCKKTLRKFRLFQSKIKNLTFLTGSQFYCR